MLRQHHRATMSTIQLETSGAIATVIINRPARHNSVDLATWRLLGDAVADLAPRGDIRCVVFRGAGDRAFCAGHDLTRFPDDRRTSDQVRAFAELTRDITAAIRDMPQPTVAMIRGFCMGAGVQISTNCDIRIAAESSRLALTPKKVGLFLEYDLLDALVSVVGVATAMEMVLEARVYDAAEALAKGLVQRVVPDDNLDDETTALALRLVEREKPDGITMIRRHADR